MKYSIRDVEVGMLRGIARYVEESQDDRPARPLEILVLETTRNVLDRIDENWEPRGVRLFAECISLGVFARARHKGAMPLTVEEIVKLSEPFHSLLNSWCGWGCPEADEQGPYRLA